MSWICSTCTFENPLSQTQSCKICFSHNSPPSTSSNSLFSNSPKWPCKACTFLNPYTQSACEICSTRNHVTSLSTLQELNSLDDELDSSVGSVFFPLKRCKKNERDPIKIIDDFQEPSSVKQKKDKAIVVPDDVNRNTSLSTLKIMTYNVWFREDIEMHKRMKAIGDLIQLHSPDIICFQEVTSNIYDIFQKSEWWKLYSCSVSSIRASMEPYFCMQLSKLPVISFLCEPFSNTVMGRELCIVKVETQANKPLVIGTSHLESPCPGPPKWDQMYSKERVAQAKMALKFLKENPNVVFCGDMNWDDKLDGKFPLLDGWIDAWTELRPGELGFTYDTKSNQMLSGNRTLQRRLDRFVCSLCDFKLSRIDMIGTEAISGISYFKEKKVRAEIKKITLPVLPSDHFGLVLTFNSV